MVAYHSVRTSCASWYSQYYIWETGGNTWRQQEDYNLTSDIVLPRSYVWECTARPEGYNYLCSENTESWFNSFIGSIKSMKYAKNYSDCNFLNRFVTVTCEYTQATVKHWEKTCEVIQEDTVSPNWDGLGSVVNP
jgi:hypothetical protein